MKTVLVTGGNKGIGFATAREFLNNGYNVIISGRSKERLQNAVEKLGGNSRYIIWDAADVSVAPKALKEAHIFFGNIDTIINNAGIVTDEDIRGVDFLKKPNKIGMIL